MATAAGKSDHGTLTCANSGRVSDPFRTTARPSKPRDPMIQVSGGGLVVVMAAAQRAVGGITGNQIEGLSHRHVHGDSDVLRDNTQGKQDCSRGEQDDDDKGSPALDQGCVRQPVHHQ